MLSYYTAWLKYYYPTEFMFSVLKNESDKDAKTEYLIESKRLGIKILLPHINESDVDFIFVGGSLVMNDYLNELVDLIKTATDIPVILFPGSNKQISRHADAILLLSSIKSNDFSFYNTRFR